MAIAAISAALPSLPALTTPAVNPPAPTGPGSFSDMLVGALENLDTTQTKADNLAVKAATGDLKDIHDYTIAATEATLATELTVAVRDKAVRAFESIMTMGI
jgi:flagellar hook-basal body complex protein FliE